MSVFCVRILVFCCTLTYLMVPVYSLHSRNCSETLSKDGYRIDCSRRNFTYIPKWLPSSMTELDISYNPLRTIPDDTFVSASSLKRLIMNNCQIMQLTNFSFKGLTELLFLDLTSNLLQVTGISNYSFEPLISLTDLLISNNSFYIEKQYPDEAMSYLRNLTHLSIEAVSGIKFGKGFEELLSLTSLEVIFWMDKSVIITNESLKSVCMGSLKDILINMHNGRFDLIDIGAFKHCRSLTGFRIEIDNNSDIKMLLKSLFGLQGRSMEYILLSHCNERFRINPISITPMDFQYLKNICTKRIDISFNHIKIDASFSDALMSMKHKECLEEINISDNIFAFEFAPFTILFSRFVNLRSLYIDRMKKLGNSFVSHNSAGGMLIDPGNKIMSGDMNISYHSEAVTSVDIFLSPNLELLSIAYMHSRDVYIPIVTFHGGKIKTFDLSYATFDSCNGEIRGLSVITHFSMSGWNCHQLGPNLISNMTTLEILEAEDSKLDEGFSENSGRTFLRGLNHLSVIKLSKNSLIDLHEEFFRDQHKLLQDVHMGNNKFKSIPFDVSKFSKLQFIDLSNNVISTISKSEQTDLDNIEKITGKLTLDLSGNQLQCTCNNLIFLRWMNKTKLNFRNIADTHCVNDKQTVKSITEILNNFDTFSRECTTDFWLMFSAISVTILITGLILSVLGYRYRFVLEYFILRIKRRLKKYKPLEDYYEYDVFVSYSSLDYEWVTRCLYVKLSEEFNVCLYDRDFVPGVPITENIINAIDSSRKVMFVITENFLSSSWGNYEMEMTRMHAFQNGRDNIVIVILKDDIDVSDMPKVLRSLWWKVVCLRWSDSLLPGGEDLFWAKARESILH